MTALTSRFSKGFTDSWGSLELKRLLGSKPVLPVSQPPCTQVTGLNQELKNIGRIEYVTVCGSSLHQEAENAANHPWLFAYS